MNKLKRVKHLKNTVYVHFKYLIQLAAIIVPAKCSQETKKDRPIREASKDLFSYTIEFVLSMLIIYTLYSQTLLRFADGHSKSKN